MESLTEDYSILPRTLQESSAALSSTAPFAGYASRSPNTGQLACKLHSLDSLTQDLSVKLSTDVVALSFQFDIITSQLNSTIHTHIYQEFTFSVSD